MSDVSGSIADSPVGMRLARGLLIEYVTTKPPLVLPFRFNPSSITTTRTLTVNTGTREAGRFDTPDEAQRAAQGATAKPDSLSFDILLDATDRIGAGDPVATSVGVQPEIDVIRTMLEPTIGVTAGSEDIRTAQGDDGTDSAQQALPPVLVFKWGVRLLPVFMTQATVKTNAHLPGSLFPYRAEVSVTLQVIETNNPFYAGERRRRELSARGLGLAGLASELLKF